MVNYKYDQSQEKAMLKLMESINLGKFPIVRINKEIFEECYLSEGMIARVVAMELEDKDLVGGFTDKIFRFIMDFKDFENFNDNFDKPNWLNRSTGEFNLTARESGNLPQELRECVYHSITHGKIFFEVVDSEKLFLEFLESKEPNYIEWLEEKVYSK